MKLKRLIIELLTNGKSLVAWALNEVPGLTAYPGIVEALKDYAAAPTKQNLANVLFQALWAVASAHRFLKIAKDA